MANNDLPPVILPRATPGSKRGWPVVSGQVPPLVAVRIAVLAARRGLHKGDLIHVALEEYLAREDRAAA